MTLVGLIWGRSMLCGTTRQHTWGDHMTHSLNLSGALLMSFSLLLWGCAEDAQPDSSAGGAGGEAGTAGAGGEAGAGSAGGGAGMAGAGGEAGMAGAGGAAMSDCLPHDDMCPEGQYCQYTEGRLRCIADGDVAPDIQNHNPPDCPTGVCSRGGICHDRYPGEALGRLRCYVLCDPSNAGISGPSVCANGRHTCHQAVDQSGQELPYAVCDY